MESPTDDLPQGEGPRERGREREHRLAHVLVGQAHDEIRRLKHAGVDFAGHVGAQVDAEGAALLHQGTRRADICAHRARRVHRDVVPARLTQLLA